MKIRTFAAALMLVMLPGLAASACIGHTAQTMTCADGQIWDSETRTCLPNTTS